MARPAEEMLVRRRRRALLVAAVVLAIPLGFAVRKSGEWTTFGFAMVLLLILMAAGTQIALGPWTRDHGGIDEDPDPGPGKQRRLRRHEDEGEQLVLGTVPRRTRVHARH